MNRQLKLLIVKGEIRMNFPPSIHKIIHNFWSKKGAVLIQTGEENRKEKMLTQTIPLIIVKRTAV